MGRPRALEALDVVDVVADAIADLVIVRPYALIPPSFQRAIADLPAKRNVSSGEENLSCRFQSCLQRSRGKSEMAESVARTGGIRKTNLRSQVLGPGRPKPSGLFASAQAALKRSSRTSICKRRSASSATSFRPTPFFGGTTAHICSMNHLRVR